MGKNKFLNSAYNTLSELSERDGNQLKKVTDQCDELTYAADGRKLRVTYKIDTTATIEPGEPFLPHGSISPLSLQIMAN